MEYYLLNQRGWGIIASVVYIIRTDFEGGG